MMEQLKIVEVASNFGSKNTISRRKNKNNTVHSNKNRRCSSNMDWSSLSSIGILNETKFCKQTGCEHASGITNKVFFVSIVTLPHRIIHFEVDT